VLTNISVGQLPQGIAVNPKTRAVYVANEGDGTVSVINRRTYTVMATIPVGPAFGIAADAKTDGSESQGSERLVTWRCGVESIEDGYASMASAPFGMPRDAPEGPSTAGDRHQQHPAYHDVTDGSAL